MRGTSMASSIAAVPSLSSDSPASSSSRCTSSIDTRIASELAVRNMLEDDGTGVLIVPASAVVTRTATTAATTNTNSTPPASTAPTTPPVTTPLQEYTCLFHILDCHKSFTEVEHWKLHVLSHFRTHAPPSTARCPLCPSDHHHHQTSTTTTSPPSSSSASSTCSSYSTEGGTKFISTPTATAWDSMLDHVDVAHYQRGQTLAGSRPDFELMRYLYQLRIISEDQFKVLQLSPARGSPAYHRSQDSVRARVGSSDEPFCAPYSRRREERMRGSRRGVSCVV